MAVKITYIDKDAFINSKNFNENTGIDEILSIGSSTGVDGGRIIQRALIRPRTSQILDLIQTEQITDYEAHLRFRTSTVEAIPQTVTLFLNAIKTHNDVDWVMGSGKEGDIPRNTSGVSWNSITGEDSNPWINISGSVEPEIPFEATASSYDTTGGATWYSGSKYEYTASLDYKGYTLDPAIDLTGYIDSVKNLEIKDNGLVVRFDEELENGSRDYRMNFFSKETNTIFYPTVHIYWDNQIYQTAGIELIEDNNIYIKISNSKTSYSAVGNVRLDIHVRPRYVDRKFTTSSIYLEKYALPQDALWALEDYYTGEDIIPFVENYTKVNCDINGPYIDIDMSMLPLERFYRIKIKANINNSEVVEKLEPFKVSKHG